MFASLFNNFGLEHSRRDDLVSVGYILLYLLTGTLPWEDFINKNEDKEFIILNYNVGLIKNNFRRNLKTLVYPKEFIEYIDYNQRMLFEVKPDYDYL